LPAGPGALIGGWLGEHVDLRAALGFAGVGALAVAMVAWRVDRIRDLRQLPVAQEDPSALGAEAAVTPVVP
jgi:hypothetical protein